MIKASQAQEHVRMCKEARRVERYNTMKTYADNDLSRLIEAKAKVGASEMHFTLPAAVDEKALEEYLKENGFKVLREAGQYSVSW